MPALTIKNVSPDALNALHALARREGRPEAEVAGEILERALTTAVKAGRGEIARRIRSMTPDNRSQPDSVAMIRRLRNERAADR